MRHNVFNQGPRPFKSYSIDCLAIYYFSIQIINLISKIEHTAIEGVQGRLWAQQNDLRSLLIRRITCKSIKVNKTKTASGDQNARCGDKMAEARRCGKRHGDGFPSRVILRIRKLQRSFFWGSRRLRSPSLILQRNHPLAKNTILISLHVYF